MCLLCHIFLLSLYNWLEHLYCIAFGVFGITFDAHPHSGWFICLAPNGARRTNSHINKKTREESSSRVLFYFFLITKIPTSITIPSDAMVPYSDKLSSRKFADNCIRVIAKSSKALHSRISLKLGLRFIYFKNDLCSLLISIVPF